MNVEHYIYYYDKFGTIQKFRMSDAFDMWVDHHGGKKQFLESLNKLLHSPTYSDYQIGLAFTTFFQKSIGSIITDDDVVKQDYLYNPEFYAMYIARVSHDYQTRIFSPQNIIVIIILVLATMGLISMCE